jgi:hypothetical protein
MGQTNEQQRHFNEWPVSELHGEVDNQFKTTVLPPSNNGMSSVSFKREDIGFGRWGKISRITEDVICLLLIIVIS